MWAVGCGMLYLVRTPAGGVGGKGCQITQVMGAPRAVFFVYCPGSFSQPAGNALPTPRGHRGTPPRSASGTAGGGGGQVCSESFASTLFLYAKR